MRRNTTKSFIGIGLMSVLVAGCGEDPRGVEAFIRTEEATAIRLVSTTQLMTQNSSNHFAITARFDKVGATVILYANGKDELENAVSITLVAATGNQLRGSVTGGSGGFATVNDFVIPGVELAKPVTLSVDVHNGEGGANSAHVLVWKGEGNYAVPEPPVAIPPNAPVPPLYFNRGVSGAGQGKRWGVRHSKDGVFLPSNPRVLLDAPKYEH